MIEGQLEPVEEDADTFGSPATVMPGIPAVRHGPTADEIRVAAQQGIAKKPDVNADSYGARAASDPASTQSASNAKPERNNALADEAERSKYDWREPAAPLSRGARVGYVLLSFLLFVTLLANAGYWFRDEISSRFPSTTRALTAACAQLGCRVQPPRRSEALGFVGSDLAADPAHKGLLIFTATLKNSGSYAVALPSLVLTLDGIGGEPIARRAFSPEQYAPANASLTRGLEAGGDLEIKLYLDVSPAVPVGFKADHAYF